VTSIDVPVFYTDRVAVWPQNVVNHGRCELGLARYSVSALVVGEGQ
jgi:hypothetical protein